MLGLSPHRWEITDELIPGNALLGVFLRHAPTQASPALCPGARVPDDGGRSHTHAFCQLARPHSVLLKVVLDCICHDSSFAIRQNNLSIDFSQRHKKIW